MFVVAELSTVSLVLIEPILMIVETIFTHDNQLARGIADAVLRFVVYSPRCPPVKTCSPLVLLSPIPQSKQ